MGGRGLSRLLRPCRAADLGPCLPRLQMLRDNKFGVYTAADAFISLIWHAMLMYWAVLALNKGWHVGWPVIASLALLLSFRK